MCGELDRTFGVRDGTVGHPAKDRIAELEPDPELESWIIDVLQRLFKQRRSCAYIAETAAEPKQLQSAGAEVAGRLR